MQGDTAFVQVVEVWSPEGDRLRFRSGAYGPHTAFAELSRETSFARGEGLPGVVWSTGQPQIWSDLSEKFVRAQAAEASGLDAAVGIPVFNADDVVAVVVLLCGSRTHTGGCIESWQVDGELQELFLAGAYYGQLQGFAEVSRRMRFQRGRGLPGLTWQARTAKIIEDTRASTSFLRASLARKNDIGAGLGIPIFNGTYITHVLLLLCAHRTPLARAFEVWCRDPDGFLVIREAAYAERLEEFARASRSTALEPGVGWIGMAFTTARPAVFDGLDASTFVRHEAAFKAGLSVGVAIPVHNGNRVVAVVALLS